MRLRIGLRPGAVALGIALMLGRIAAQPVAGSLDATIADFWRASGDRKGQIDRIVATGASFDEIHARLAAGRPYEKDVATGELAWQTIISGGARLATTVIVPADYDPQLKYPVRVYLHGGIARASIDTETRGSRRRLDAPPGTIAVYPAGFREATWWSTVQLDNLESILARLKRTYNVDENRAHLMGVSDGGTGAFYFGMRRATPWSVLFPLNGSLRVLSNPDVGAEGELYLTNLVNLPAYVINGGRDQLYPVSATEPYIVLLKRAGAPVVFRPQMLAGHDTSWWPSERGAIDEFERSHPRDPLPDRISWRTDRTDRDNRFRWLVIDTLDDRRSSSRLDDYNTVEFINPPITEDVFRHRRASGRVDLERTGNTVRARTRGVGAFTLLLSRADFDFEKPVEVTVNGREVFKRRDQEGRPHAAPGGGARRGPHDAVRHPVADRSTGPLMEDEMAWRLRVVAMVAAVVGGVVSSAPAQPAAPAPADSWPCAPGCRLAESDEIRVTGMDGDVGQGRLRSFDATSIQLTGPDGREVVIGRDHVRQIERRGDSVLNGTLIGAAFGLGTIAAADPMGADVGAVDYIGSTALWAGLGALFDHLHKGWTRVYEKPSAPAASGKFPATFWVAPSANGLRVGFTRAF